MDFPCTSLDRLGGEGDGEVVGDDPYLLDVVPGRGTTDGGAETSRQLVHAEGFGDVVVGTAVEA